MIHMMKIKRPAPDIEASESWRKSDHEELSADYFRNSELLHYNMDTEQAEKNR